MTAVTNAVMTPATFGREFNTFMQGVPLFPVRMGSSGIVFNSDEGAVIGNRVEPLVGISGKRDFFKLVKGAMPAGEVRGDSRILDTAKRLDGIMDEDLGDIFGRGFEHYLRDSSAAWATWQHLKIDGHFQARKIMINYTDEFHTKGDYSLLSELAQAMLDTLPLNPGMVDPVKAAFVSGVLSSFTGVEGGIKDSAGRAAQAFLIGAEHMSCSGDLVGPALVADIAAHVAERGGIEEFASMRRMVTRRWADALEGLRGHGHEADFEAALYRGLLSGWKGRHYEELEQLYSRSAGFRGNADRKHSGEDRLRAAQVRMKMSDAPTDKDWAQIALYLGMAWDDLAKVAVERSVDIDLEKLRVLAKAARRFNPGANVVPDLYDVP